MAMSGPVLMRALKHFHTMSRDSFFYLKDRTSEQSLTTLEMEKNCKQMVEHRASQSPCLLPMVRLYPRYTFLVKEKGKTFDHRFHLTCLQYVSMHRSAQTHLGGNRGFHHLRLKKVDPEPC